MLTPARASTGAGELSVLVSGGCPSVPRWFHPHVKSCSRAVHDRIRSETQRRPRSRDGGRERERAYAAIGADGEGVAAAGDDGGDGERVERGDSPRPVLLLVAAHAQLPVLPRTPTHKTHRERERRRHQRRRRPRKRSSRSEHSTHHARTAVGREKAGGGAMGGRGEEAAEQGRAEAEEVRVFVRRARRKKPCVPPSCPSPSTESERGRRGLSFGARVRRGVGFLPFSLCAPRSAVGFLGFGWPTKREVDSISIHTPLVTLTHPRPNQSI